MAEKGFSLDAILSTAERVAESVGTYVHITTDLCVMEDLSLSGTMSVSLSPCSVPGHKPSFTLGEDQMELGLGMDKNCYSS